MERSKVSLQGLYAIKCFLPRLQAKSADLEMYLLFLLITTPFRVPMLLFKSPQRQYSKCSCIQISYHILAQILFMRCVCDQTRRDFIVLSGIPTSRFCPEGATTFNYQCFLTQSLCQLIRLWHRIRIQLKAYGLCTLHLSNIKK